MAFGSHKVTLYLFFNTYVWGFFSLQTILIETLYEFPRFK